MSEIWKKCIRMQFNDPDITYIVELPNTIEKNL